MLIEKKEDAKKYNDYFKNDSLSKRVKIKLEVLGVNTVSDLECLSLCCMRVDSPLKISDNERQFIIEMKRHFGVEKEFVSKELEDYFKLNNENPAVSKNVKHTLEGLKILDVETLNSTSLRSIGGCRGIGRAKFEYIKEMKEYFEKEKQKDINELKDLREMLIVKTSAKIKKIL